MASLARSEQRRQWRDLVVEPALDPSLQIVDAHHHLWDESPVPKFDCYTVDDFRADMVASGHNVIGTVAVDSHSYYRPDGPIAWRGIGEAEHMARLAEESESLGPAGKGICAGIVTNVDLCLGKAAGDIIDAHIAAAPRHLRGIRNITAHDPDDPNPYGNGAGVLLRDDFRAGFAELAPRGLSYDASPLHPQLPELLDLARCFPETRIIIDHTGKPLKVGRYANHRAEAMAEWASAMRELARCPNVYLKLGGFNMDVDLAQSVSRPPTSEEAARAYGDFFLTAIEVFGPQRCMFESNFPADKIGISYGVLWNSFKRVTSGFTVDEKKALFSGTAIAAYRLNIKY